MSYAFSKIVGLKMELCPCPFCGGTPEWVVIPGEDYIMRCSKCHASTPKARQVPEEAAADWNAHDIFDVNFTITSDTKIDRYFQYGVKKVLFSNSSDYECFPTMESGFLCRSAVIVTDKIILGIEPEKSHLLYDELSGYSSSYYKNSIVPEETEIKFFRSKWRKRNLLSLEFNCGDTQIVIASEAKKGCMIVYKNKFGQQEGVNRDWRYSVAGNITKTHIDEQGVLRYGSSSFRGGTKVYICGKYWSKGRRTIGVVGMNRFGRYVFSDVAPELIENVRCQRVYKPSVLAIMADWEFGERWWGKSAEDKTEAQRFVDSWNNSLF